MLFEEKNNIEIKFKLTIEDLCKIVEKNYNKAN